MLVFMAFIPLAVAIEKPDPTTTEGFIKLNANNIHTISVDSYPSEWNCVDIANSFMRNNSDWAVLTICVEGGEFNHGANYQIINDRLFVHDEGWGVTYEFEDWKNMTLHKYVYGVETVQGNHTVVFNDNGFVIEAYQSP